MSVDDPLANYPKCCSGHSLDYLYQTYTCCANSNSACAPGWYCCGLTCCREGITCCGSICCNEGYSCSTAQTCVARTTTSRSSTTTTRQPTGTTTPSEGDEDNFKKGLSQSDRIALGVGLGIGIPTLLIGFTGLIIMCNK
ncbi:hypothetical protein BU25DRAFT_29617 [Macroventuria anomochaeta]|uniref:Uncharacterized protein n=1 Tax=Macroventuria anomochaeta TaxID=301207 RepID=A0ACB6S5L0_9PLEO|nr:uncharacterized protein BU25DRAFT_29617 [Macroventuria anomochaeta]KAF2628679.1 hypothetical protein BU25DRAFT_29617 [Macroventuria anomochaeta]